MAFVVPWPERGTWIWGTLPPDTPHTTQIIPAAPKANTFFDKHRLPPYVSEWYHVLRQRRRLTIQDVVFCWEMRCSLAVALLLGGRTKTKLVVVGPILKGPLLRVLPVVRLLLARAERIVCFSRAECDDYARLLKLPRDRFVFLPTPWLSDETESERDDGYILALGQSNRDYATLLEAVRGTDLPVVIVAGNESALGGVEVPPNVSVCYNTGHDETNTLIARAAFHCIPLHAAGYSAGQTVLLRAMACGKAVVVSDTPGIRDYVRDGETALLVPPADVPALRAALFHLWTNADERKRIGSKRRPNRARRFWL